VLDKGTSLFYYMGMTSTIHKDEHDARNNKPVDSSGQYVPWWDLRHHDFADPHVKDNAHPAKDIAWDMLWHSVQKRFMSKELHERVAGAVDRVYRVWTQREDEELPDNRFDPYNLATAIFDGAGKFVEPYLDYATPHTTIVFWTLFYNEFKNWAYYKRNTTNTKFYNLAFEMHKKGQHDT